MCNDITVQSINLHSVKYKYRGNNSGCLGIVRIRLFEKTGSAILLLMNAKCIRTNALMLQKADKHARYHQMVLILDCNSEIDAQVWSNLCCLICLRHLIRSRLGTNRFFESEKSPIFLHACASCFGLPSTMYMYDYTIQTAAYIQKR